MAEGDRERWNARWRDRPGALAPPSAFLVAHAELIPSDGRALDVGGGAGRHAVWLARRGLDVTLIDVSDLALEQTERRATDAGVAHRLRLLRIDLDDGALPPGPFDVIVMFHYLNRERRDAIAELLTGGGVLVAVQPTIHNRERHAKPGPEYLVDPGELDAWARRIGLDVLVSREGWTTDERHEAELIARRL